MTTNLSKPCESKNNEISENTSDNIEVKPKSKNIKVKIPLSAAPVTRIFTDRPRVTAEQEHIIESNLTPDKYEALSLSYFGTFIPPSHLTRDEANLFISQYIKLPERTNVVEGEPKIVHKSNGKRLEDLFVEGEFKSKNTKTKITKLEPVKYINLTTNYPNSTELSMDDRVETKSTRPRNTKSNLKIPLSMEDVDIRTHKNKCPSSEGIYKSIWDMAPPTYESSKISFIPSSFIPSDDISLKPQTQQLNSSKITGKKISTKRFQRRMSMKNVSEVLKGFPLGERRIDQIHANLFCDEIEQSSDEIVKEKDEEENA